MRTGGRADGRLRASAVGSSRTATVFIGNTVMLLSSSSDRWVVESNRSDVMSSPHHSSRAGTAMPKPYRSRIPPRTLNSATSVTVGTRR